MKELRGNVELTEFGLPIANATLRIRRVYLELFPSGVFGHVGVEVYVSPTGKPITELTVLWSELEPALQQGFTDQLVSALLSAIQATRFAATNLEDTDGKGAAEQPTTA